MSSKLSFTAHLILLSILFTLSSTIANAEETTPSSAPETILELPTAATAVTGPGCGLIIEDFGFGDISETAIEDCDNPFNADTSFRPYTFFVGDTVVTDGDTVAVDFAAGEPSFDAEVERGEAMLSSFVYVYKRVGDDYLIDSNRTRGGGSSFGVGSISEPGEYTAVITAAELFFSEKTPGFKERVLSFFIPTAHAYYEDYLEVTVVNFTVTETATEEAVPLSELLLKYEPILQFHEAEQYFPMNVEAFVEGSGLWDSSFIDEVIIPRVADPITETNELTLDYLATTTDTSNWYITFSSDEPGSFDLAEAKRRYDSLVEAGIAVPTYYAHESEHSYIDDLGTEHEFIVLQYWYFYAMNNWGEQGGFNNHEGDWESVFVFLDKETEEPEYVAFSAHHNDGENELLNLLQYGSVRRTWEETERMDTQVVSYVAAGAHAMYSFAADHRVTLTSTDRTSRSGDVYKRDDWKKRKMTKEHESFTSFEGLYGARSSIPGFSGTQGPFFTKVSGSRRFIEPIKWAGIDKITKATLEEPEQTFAFNSQGASFFFNEVLPKGTEFASSVFEEFISFGQNSTEIKLLPKFWDFSISLPNGSFVVETTLQYDPTILSPLEISEDQLGVFFYNEEIDTWELVPSVLNEENDTISFVTDHFSIYTIGEVPASPNDNTGEVGTSTDPELDQTDEKLNQNTGTRVQRDILRPQVLGMTTGDEEVRLQLMLEVINLLKRKLTLLLLN